MIEIELRIDCLNNKRYFIKGTDLLHREDGPAYENVNGDKYWIQNDYLHRLDGPAIEYADGSKQWIQNGKMYRLDGPAVESASGVKFWYFDNQRIDCQTQKEFEKIIKLKAFW